MSNRQRHILTHGGLMTMGETSGGLGGFVFGDPIKETEFPGKFLGVDTVTLVANPIVPNGAVGEFDHGVARDECALYARGKYWCWYTCKVTDDAGDTPPRIALSSATDPTVAPWTKHGVVLQENPAADTWWSGGVFSPCVWYDEAADELYVYVSGIETPAGWYAGPIRIGVWKVAAGADWTVASNYVLQNSGTYVLQQDQSWEGSQGNYSPGVVKANGKWVIFYSSYPASGGGWKVGAATADAPAGPFTKLDSNPISTASNIEEAAPLMLRGGGQIMFFDDLGGAATVALWKTAKHDALSGWAQQEIVNLGTTSWMDGTGSCCAVQMPTGDLFLTFHAHAPGGSSPSGQIGGAVLTLKDETSGGGGGGGGGGTGGPILQYKFNSGAFLTDTGSSGLDLTANGSGVVSTTGISGDGATGFSTDNYLSASTSLCSGSDGLTICFWINPTSVTGYFTPISMWLAALKWVINITPSGTILFTAADTGATNFAVESDVLTAETWTFVACRVAKGGNIEVKLGTGTTLGSWTSASFGSNQVGHAGSTTLEIGAQTSDGFTYSGVIDDIEVFDYARSDDQIAASFNGGAGV